MDCDMLVRSDIKELFDMREDKRKVLVAQHQYKPVMGNKFLGQEQTDYVRKNWSSVMLFNNEKCQELTPEYVNETKGLDLHQFKWCEGTDIGSFPKSWNYLVGENVGGNPHADIVHFTRGGPYFKEYKDCEYSKEWFEYWRESNSVLDRRVLCSEV
jgi:hypothetical protein